MEIYYPKITEWLLRSKVKVECHQNLGFTITHIRAKLCEFVNVSITAVAQTDRHLGSIKMMLVSRSIAIMQILMNMFLFRNKIITLEAATVTCYRILLNPLRLPVRGINLSVLTRLNMNKLCTNYSAHPTSLTQAMPVVCSSPSCIVLSYRHICHHHRNVKSMESICF